MHIERRLSDLRDRLRRARKEQAIVEEQLLFQADVVEEAKTRMLVSENPVADRNYRIARDDYERLADQRDAAGAEIRELEAEQDRLLDRLLNA